MTRSTRNSVFATMVLASALSACGQAGGFNDDRDFTSPEKPDPIDLPILCPQAPQQWTGSEVYPIDWLNVGTQRVDAPTVFAQDGEARDDREAIIAEVAAVLLNMEVGDQPTDKVLVAVASLDAWLVATEMAGDLEGEPVPDEARTTLSLYFDDLRPCLYDDRPTAVEVDAEQDSGDALDRPPHRSPRLLGASL